MHKKPFRQVVFDVRDTTSRHAWNEDFTSGFQGGKHERRFNFIYIKFESSKDCTFSIEVTFPKEEEFVKRKKVFEMQKKTGFASKKSPQLEEDPSQEDRVSIKIEDKKKLVPALVFKR